MRTPLYAAIPLLAAICLSAQQFPSSAGRQSDLDFVATTIPSRHPNFYNQLDRGTFQQAVAELNARLATATDAEFYVGLARLVAMAGDAHTSLNYTNAPFRFFPLRFRSFDDGIFVVRAASQYADTLGTRLIRIGDTPIEQAIPQLSNVIPHENDPWLQAQIPGFLINQTILQGLGLVGPEPTSSLTFRRLDGSEFTLVVDTGGGTFVSANAEDQGPIPLYQQNSNLNYWYSYSALNRLLYFKYNACTDSPLNPFASFAADLLSTLDRNSVDTLVFDVRGNGGGGSAVVAPFFNGLAARFPALSANPRFRIYDVFDQGTFSSGMLNAQDLLLPYPASIPNANQSVDLSTFVTSIGQPTGGKPTAYGIVTGFTLPGSRIPGQISTGFIRAPAGGPDLSSVMPSIPVSLRSTDYFARFDPVMATILGRGEGAPVAPSGDAIVVNAASFRIDQGVAPGSYAAVFGSFTAVPDSVTIDGASATLVSSSTSQVNFVMPVSVALGPATVAVRARGNTLASGKVTISRTGAGIFVIQPANPSQPGAILNQDGAVNGPSNPAATGSVVQIFGTGYGGEPVQVYFAEQPGEVVYSGPLIQSPGLWQVNARVPTGVAGQVSIFLSSDTLASNGATLWVK